MLKQYLTERLKQKEILLMTHTVVGYPHLDESYRIVEAMVRAGVDLVELQIPFSEPIADGPVILQANQKALEQGLTVQTCLDFAARAARDFDIPIFIMSYYNIPHQYSVDRFIKYLAASNLSGAIVPDLPPEEGQEYLQAMDQHDLCPILLFAPTTSAERLRYLAALAKGFIYCVARKGVTGNQTVFSEELIAYLDRCRGATDLPLALGFGIKEKADIDFIRGRAQIAVIGSEILRIIDQSGVAAIENFIQSLREK
ncbi:MAG: tryptophan synthase subunit alpha [Desulfobacteraceae bacterium]|nr:MAG: tryptophan synthase subunit alpha [Desulfobacteraceae bacterium]